MDITKAIGRYWVAEYSTEQDAFNVTTLDMAIQANRKMVVDKENNDYLIFGIFSIKREANTACNEMRKIQAKQKEG